MASRMRHHDNYAVCARAAHTYCTGDIFVAGQFSSKLWDGENFVTLKNVARFSGKP